MQKSAIRNLLSSKSLVSLLLTVVITLSAGCATNGVEEKNDLFQAAESEGPQPWTHEQFDTSDDKFTFALFSDLTGGEREGIFEIAVEQLNLLRPDFIINVGDLIEGDTDRQIVDEQWDSFDERAGRARAPVFYVGGNHDLLGQTLQEAWEERLGRTYYHFVYRDVLFLVLDTDDYSQQRLEEFARLRLEAIEVAETQGWDAFYKTEYARMPENYGGNISQEQSRYMLDALEQNPDVRWTFLIMHKAPWVIEDMKTFTDIEDALTDRPYTVFNGHRHAYQYLQRKGRDYIRLATTGGSQLPKNGRSMDQVVLVTVDDEGVDIANLLMSGILDKTGHIPLDGDDVCFESTVCGEP